MIKKVLSLIIKLLHFLFPKKSNMIVYSSYPDFSDNSFAFFVYILKNKPKYRNIWLVDSLEIDKYKKTVTTYSKSKNFKIIKKASLRGLYYYFRTKYIFHTHGLFNVFPLSNRQTVVNLFHAMPIKVLGLLDGKKEFIPSHLTISTSKIFQQIMSDVCGLSLDKVLISGQPRNEFLFDEKATLNALFNPKEDENESTILWMPTYRKSDFGEIREDGTSYSEDSLSEKSLNKLNNYLKKINTNCYIKLHPMDVLKKESFHSYTNIFFLNNNSFVDKNVNLYSCLSCVDMLITDYSSIYVDLLLLNKPIGFFISDFEKYKESRGFTFKKPLDYMPGEIIFNMKDLITFINKTFVLKIDNFTEKRIDINSKLNEVYKDASEKIYRKVILKVDEFYKK
jgi:CDP-glycerol glycerophosphotransferase (TagB/SpsB family)|tara:strand:+ start:292 stop:1473 length:1182 start_codon:yes stop_codon:yes gene_type:complete